MRFESSFFYKMPSPIQIVGAQIRHEVERFELSHRRRVSDGVYELSVDRENYYSDIGEKYGMSWIDVTYFMTYSRYCSHSWSNGACDDCPEVGGHVLNKPSVIQNKNVSKLLSCKTNKKSIK